MSTLPQTFCSLARVSRRCVSHIFRKNSGIGVENLVLPVNGLSQPLTMVRKPRSHQGFTLVEVVLAIGIIALAFVPVLGLLPVGASVAREAIDTTVEAQITQLMTNQAQQTDFSVLDKLTDMPPQYFDYQGNKTEAAQAIYEAEFHVSARTDLPGGVATSRLKTVTICILSSKGKAPAAAEEMIENPAAKKSVILVPDNGR